LGDAFESASERSTVDIKGEMVARWLASGDVERKLGLVAGGRFDDEDDDAQWEIAGTPSAAGFLAKRIPGETTRVFRFSDLRGLILEMPAPSAETQATLAAELAAANPAEIRKAQEALRRYHHDPDRFDEPALLSLGRFIDTLSDGRMPSPEQRNALYDLLEEAGTFRLGAALFDQAFRLDPTSVPLRIQAAAMARQKGDIDTALELTRVVAGRNLLGASPLQMSMLLVIRGHALAEARRLPEADECASRSWAIGGGADPSGQTQELFRAIAAARK